MELAALDTAVCSGTIQLHGALSKAFELGRLYERERLIVEELRAKQRIPIEEAVRHSPRCGCGACPKDSTGGVGTTG